MKALRFRTFGPPSVLAIEDVAQPVTGAGDALVRVLAAAINPSDIKNVAGSFTATTLPRTPGRDFCGVVVRGSRLEGQEVWGSGPGGLGITEDGAHAEYLVVSEEALSPKPACLSVEEAAAIGVPFMTAWLGLVTTAQIEAGETVLIVGAGGAVGRAATQIANWKQARVLGVELAGSPMPGVDAVIDSSTEDLHARVTELTSGRGVDAVLDTVGGRMFEPALRSLRIGGRHVAIASTGDRRVSFDLVDFYHNASHLLGVDTLKLRAGEIARIAEALGDGFDNGALRAPDVTVVPFARAVEAYTTLAHGGAPKKLVLTFS